MRLHAAPLCCWQIRNLPVLIFMTAMSLAATLCQVWSGMGHWSLGFHLQLIIVIKLFKDAYSNTLLLLDAKEWSKGKLDS